MIKEELHSKLAEVQDYTGSTHELCDIAERYALEKQIEILNSTLHYLHGSTTVNVADIEDKITELQNQLNALK